MYAKILTALFLICICGASAEVISPSLEYTPTDPQAQCDYAKSFLASKTPDYKNAIFWYEKAAISGSVEAKSALGSIYLKGDGLDRDLTKALYYLEEAAKAGDKTAKYNLAVCYENGVGVMRNMEKARILLLESAEAGDLFAQDKLGKSDNSEIEMFSKYIQICLVSILSLYIIFRLFIRRAR